jgi:DNA-3-methyladenine glycosylase
VKVLPRDFAARDTRVVAKALLGQWLVHEVDGVRRVGRIVEIEAYLGPHDLACHTSKGRTARTEVMFGPPGHAYVFLVYGMHHCVNVVTGGGAAVLIRALEPLQGLAAARTDGPGRLTRALGINRSHDGLPLDRPPLYLAAGLPVRRVGTSPRIGVDYAGDWARKPLRYFEKDNPFVSG